MLGGAIQLSRVKSENCVLDDATDVDIAVAV